MSISPLPVHMSCYGISSDAVAMARGYSKSNYSDRLASVRTALAAASSDAASMPSSHISSAALGAAARPAAQTSPTRQAPQVKLQPLAADHAQQYLSSAGSAAPASNSTPNSMLAYRSHTKHAKAVAPTLQALDFISIAVNSVGGGGVPRPYGRFQACRSGDGNATWERVPPQPGSWQARALPIAVTLLGDGPPVGAPGPPAGPGAGPTTGGQRHSGGDAVETSSRSETHYSPTTAASRRSSNYSAPPGTCDSPRSQASGIAGLRLGFTGSPEHNPRHSHTYPHTNTRGLTRATYPGPAQNTHSTSPHPPPRNGGGPPPAKLSAANGAVSGPGALPSRLHEHSYYRRPGSSMHRSLVPLPPPEPNNLSAWFALPAATFLADVPQVPEQLRMDNGYSVSREFLMSGLNPPRARPQPMSPPLSPTQRLGAQHSHQQQQQMQQQQYHHHHHHHQQDQQQQQDQQHHPQSPSDRQHAGFHHPHPEVRVADKNVLWDALEKGSQAQHSSPPPGNGPSRIRGVYVPLDKRYTPEGSQLGSEDQMYDSTPSLLAGGSVVRGTAQLPPEQMLPRRNEPTGR